MMIKNKTTDFFKKILTKQKFSKSIEKKFPHSVSINLYSSSEILDRSCGEVTNLETYDYKDMKPVIGGLYCEKIFGAKEDFSCSCGLYIGKLYQNLVCSECGVQVLSFEDKRSRFGHIILSVPCIHPWFLGSNNRILSNILNIPSNELNKLINYNLYINIELYNPIHLTNNVFLSTEQFEELQLYNPTESSNYKIGGEAIEILLEKINIEQLIKNLKEEDKKEKNKPRLEVLYNLNKTHVNIKNIILKVLPILSSSSRPIALLENGNYGSVDTNQFYRTVIMRNKRFETLISMQDLLPESVFNGAKLLLQQSINELFDNESQKKPALSKNGRILKSLTMLIKGKFGILRLNLLGKRTDFSGRSVIITNPILKLDQLGLPKSIAIELFKPFIINRLINLNIALNISVALKQIKFFIPEVEVILKKIVESKYVLINRAPTLHRMNIQAFKIKLVEHNAVEFHPLLCESFNADHDGDQVGIYAVLTDAGTIEAKMLMSSHNNIFSLATGKPLIQPVREMRMGLVWLSTTIKSNKEDILTIFNINELNYLLEEKIIHIREEIRFITDDNQNIITNAGKVILNNLLPIAIRDYNSTWENNFVNIKIDELYKLNGLETVSIFLDKIKTISLKYITQAGISMSLEDLIAPNNKDLKIQQAYSLIQNLNKLSNYLIDNEKEHLQNIIWYSTIDELTNEMLTKLDKENDIYLAIISKARCNITQLRQLAVARGLLADLEGNIIPAPVLNSYKEGLKSIHYFISSYGARKGIVNRAIDTQEGGKTTRSLVDATHKIIIKEIDCLNNVFSPFLSLNFYQNIIGRILAVDTLNYKKNSIITDNMSKVFEKANMRPLIRHILDCKSIKGVCSFCYGWDLSKQKIIDIGSTVGILAAQSVGEPVLQLTMRTFHTGGVVENPDLLSMLYCDETTTIKFNKECFIFFNLIENNLFKGQVIKHTEILVGSKSISLPMGSIITFDEKHNKFNNGDLLAIINYVEILIAKADEQLLVDDIMLNQPLIEETTLNTSKERTITLPENSVILTKNLTEGNIFAKKFVELKSKDILGDLNKLESILELRKPKIESILAPYDGKIIIEYQSNTDIYILLLEDEKGDKQKLYQTHNINTIIVDDNALVKKGDTLTHGQINYRNLLNIFTESETKMKFLTEIQDIYYNSNININSKHLEILIKRMFDFVLVTYTKSIGEDIQKSIIIEKELLAGIDPSIINLITPKILGMSQLSSMSASFLSSASFRNSKKVLMQSSIYGLVDNLEGLKENLIIGNYLPCGTTSLDLPEKIAFDKLHLSLPESKILQKYNSFVIIKCMKEKLSYVLRSDPDFTYQKDWVEKLFQMTIKEL